MRSYAEQRAMLARMVRAWEETRNHLAIVERQIVKRGEIDALTRKLERQEGAIAAFRVRHRINEAPEELAL